MDNGEKTALEAIRTRLEKYLNGKPFYFNPDTNTVESILRAMVKRKAMHGEDYCPCRRVTGDREKDAAIICPCVYHVAEIAADGRCHCHLFTSI